MKNIVKVIMQALMIALKVVTAPIWVPYKLIKGALSNVFKKGGGSCDLDTRLKMLQAERAGLEDDSRAAKKLDKQIEALEAEVAKSKSGEVAEESADNKEESPEEPKSSSPETNSHAVEEALKEYSNLSGKEENGSKLVGDEVGLEAKDEKPKKPMPKAVTPGS